MSYSILSLSKWILFLFVGAFLSCRLPDDFTLDSAYTFHYNLRAFPHLKTYKIGDTLWIQNIQNDIFLFEERTQLNIAVKDLLVPISMAAYSVNQNLEFNLANKPIKIISRGNITNFEETIFRDHLQAKFRFGCINKSTNFEIGFVLESKGLFFIYPENYIPNTDKLYETDSLCNVKYFIYRTVKNIYNFENTNYLEKYHSEIKRDAKMVDHFLKLNNNKHIFWVNVE